MGGFLFKNIQGIFETLIADSRRDIGHWMAVAISGILLIVGTVLVRYIRRKWLALGLTHKVIYSGKVTNMRLDGSYKNQVNYYVTLDGVDVLVDGEEYQKVSVGNQADLHCTFPGDVFRIVRIVEAQRKGRDSKKAAVAEAALAAAPAKRISLGVVFGITALAVGLLAWDIVTWWYGSYPPAALLIRGRSVVMDVTESRVEPYRNKTGIRYKAVVGISPPLKTEALEEDKEPQRKIFPLEARPGDIDDSDKERVRKTLHPYGLGQKVTAYTLNETSGPYYAIRYGSRSLAQLATGVLFSLVLAVGAIMLYLSNRSRK